jgi:hypothetical protein
MCRKRGLPSPRARRADWHHALRVFSVLSVCIPRPFDEVIDHTLRGGL